MEILDIFKEYSGKQDSIFLCLIDEEAWAQAEQRIELEIDIDIDI